jgi:hypothetical protein
MSSKKRGLYNREWWNDMTAKINGSEAGRRKRKDRKTGGATINQTFPNLTKFHKESFLFFFILFWKARRVRHLP